MERLLRVYCLVVVWWIVRHELVAEMAPEDYSPPVPSICNDGNSYYWFNWQPFSVAHGDWFMPSTMDSASLIAASNSGKRVNSYSGNGWLLPYATASSPSRHDADGVASPNTCFLHNALEWHHHFVCSNEGDGDARAEPTEAPHLEDFLGGHRVSPPPRSAAMDVHGTALSVAGRHYPDRELGWVTAAAGASSAGSSSSDVDPSSENGYLQLPDVLPEIGLTCVPPLAVAAPRASGGRRKPLARALVGSGQRSSSYRGVTRHRWTGRYEAHLWDNTCVREGVKRKGRQVYLGGYDKEEKAARAYDLAALKYWGPTAATNFPASNYVQEIAEMNHMTRQEFIASLRRRSTGFSRGASVYRGVTRHHQHGRWQARIGRVAGNKDLYLGTFTTEEEAAEAYDIAAIKFRGINAVTNFELSRYDIEAIANANLPIGSSSKRLKLSPQKSNQSQNVMVISASQPEPSMATSFLHGLLQIHSFSGPSIASSPFGCSSTALAVDPSS